MWPFIKDGFKSPVLEQRKETIWYMDIELLFFKTIKDLKDWSYTERCPPPPIFRVMWFPHFPPTRGLPLQRPVTGSYPAILHYIWDTNQDGPGNLLLALPRVLNDSLSRNCTSPYSPSKGIPYPLQMNNDRVDCIVNTGGCPVYLFISIGICVLQLKYTTPL